MGWNVRFRALLHETEQPGGKPWYIPGYGSRNGIITGSFSVFYTFSTDRRKKAPALPPGFSEVPADEPVPTTDITEEPVSDTPEQDIPAATSVPEIPDSETPQ